MGNEVTGHSRMLNNLELCSQCLNMSQVIVSAVKCMKLRGAGHVARVGETIDITLFWYGTLIEAAFGISRRNFDSDIKVDTKEMEFFFFYWQYNALWVLAFSVILFHSAPPLHCFLHRLIPVICISSSISTIRLFLGLPLILVPIGFHSNILLGLLLSSIRIT